MTFAPQTPVQTPLGKGSVREVRNGGRVLVDVGGRAVVFDANVVTPIVESSRRKSAGRRQHETPAMPVAPPHSAHVSALEIDLHGCTVEEATTRVTATINAALLDDRAVLRFIHGRSGGRLRAALHRHLRGMPSVRHFRIDPRNEGVTIVDL